MIRRVDLAEFRARCGHLVEAAAVETKLPSQVLWPVFEELESRGMLLVLLLEVEEQPRGYAAAVMTPDWVGGEFGLATLSAYLQPDCRWSWTRRLLAELYAYCGVAGGRTLRVQALPGTRFCRLLTLLGFEAKTVVFERRVLN